MPLRHLLFIACLIFSTAPTRAQEVTGASRARQVTDDQAHPMTNGQVHPMTDDQAHQMTNGQVHPMTSAQIDHLVESTMKAFDVPGIALAIVKDGKVLYEKGYGVRSLNTAQKVDTHTLFGIASNSKAFTAAALGILVDQGKLAWDDLVITYIPEFQLYDPYVTAHFTIRDLLSHRSGLAPGAGDLMHDPDSSNFTLEDIIHNMHFIAPVSAFRTKFGYSNNMYIIAGEIVRRVSGMSWESFVEKNIMRPIGMDESFASYNGIADKSNVIDPHASIDGAVKVIPRYASEICDPAGGVYASAADMSKWAIMQLSDGKYGEGLHDQLFSQAVHKEMWTPQTIIPVGGTSLYNTHFGAYGLGWFLIDAKGYKEVFHTGEDVGMVSEIQLIPELNLGIIVLTNQEAGEAFATIVDQITDGYIGVTGTDHLKENLDRHQKGKQATDSTLAALWHAVAVRQNTFDIGVDSNKYCGLYHDNWFGDVQIVVSNHQLRFISQRSPQLEGSMSAYKDNAFVIRWRNPALNGDVLATFTLNNQGTADSISLKPVSGFFSDFQNLHFQRVQTGTTTRASVLEDSAHQKMGRNDFSGAIRDLTVAIALAPHNPYNYYNRSLAYFNLNNLSDSRRDIDLSIQLKSNFPDAYNARGVIRFHVDDFAGSLQDLDTCLRLSPNNANAFYNRGKAKAALKDYPAAVKDFDKALELSPGRSDVSFQVYNNKGICELDLKEYELAIADFNKALMLNQSYAEAYCNRGLAEIHSGKKILGCADLKKAIEMGSHNAKAAAATYCKF